MATYKQVQFLARAWASRRSNPKIEDVFGPYQTGYGGNFAKWPVKGASECIADILRLVHSQNSNQMVKIIDADSGRYKVRPAAALSTNARARINNGVLWEDCMGSVWHTQQAAKESNKVIAEHGW